MSRAADKAKARAEACEKLREFYPRGSTVYTVMDHVSRSGMVRYIRVLAISNGEKKADGSQGEPFVFHPNWSASVALDWPRAPKGDGIKVGGCGMDMGFHLAYSIASAIYGDGYALNHRWL